jgi:hypothetical protein
MRSELNEARDALEKLKQLDTAYAATIGTRGQAQRVDHHRIFLLLYCYATTRWLELAETSDCPAFFNHLLVEFYVRYRDYVFAAAIDDAPCRCANWLGYFRWAGVYRRWPGHLTRFVLLLYGIHAHIRYDLAESIAATLRTVGGVDLSKAKQEFTGPESGRALSRAALDFVFNADRLLPEIVLSAGLRSFCVYVHDKYHWWLPRYQRWRSAAWDDAMVLLETGRTTLTESRIAIVNSRAADAGP